MTIRTLPVEIFLTAKLRILWLTENYPPQRGGMAVSCDRIVRSLRSEPHVEIDVAHFSTRYVQWKIEQKAGGMHYACPVREDISHALNRFWNTIENEKFTHVVAFGGLIPMMAAPVFSAWLNAPLITFIRGNDFDAGIFSLKRSDILREALNNSVCICAVSRDKVQKISALYSNVKVVWTPNGIDFGDWAFSHYDLMTAQEWRNGNVLENRRVLGLFGHLKRKKGGLFFLENLLRSGQSDKFHLLLVGEADGEMTDWLEAHRGKVHFSILPFLDRFELLPFYAACDFIVIPSFYDGMPNVLLEATALGIPVIASKAGGMRDVLTDRETAFLFETGNDYSCRLAIENAGDSSDMELKQMSANCVELSRKYDHLSESARFLQIFHETLKKRSIHAEK